MRSQYILINGTDQMVKLNTIEMLAACLEKDKRGVLQLKKYA